MSQELTLVMFARRAATAVRDFDPVGSAGVEVAVVEYVSSSRTSVRALTALRNHVYELSCSYTAIGAPIPPELIELAQVLTSESPSSDVSPVEAR